MRKAKTWLGRFPLLRRNVVIGVGGVSLSTSIGKAEAYKTRPRTEAHIDSRLNALEKNVTAIHERIKETHAEIDEGFRKRASALSVKTITVRGGRPIREKLEATGSGGVHISAIGASWLFVGASLALHPWKLLTNEMTPDHPFRQTGQQLHFWLTCSLR